jgi:hypothetical protein
MASLFDALQLLENIGITQIIIPFLLITTIIYAFLVKTKIFGESPTINLVISASIGIIFISFRQTVEFLLGIVPMFLGLFIVILLMYMLFTFMGVTPETIGEAFTSNSVLVFIIIIMLVFVTLMLQNVVPGLSPYGDVVGEEAVVTSLDTGETTSVATQRTIAGEATRTFFAPAVLGVVALLMVAAGTMYFITFQREGK